MHPGDLLIVSSVGTRVYDSDIWESEGIVEIGTIMLCVSANPIDNVWITVVYSGKLCTVGKRCVRVCEN